MENKVRVDISQAPWVVCSEKNQLFETKIMFKKVSSLISPTGQTEYVPVEIIVCPHCGKVPRFFWEKAKDIPEELKSQCKF